MITIRRFTRIRKFRRKTKYYFLALQLAAIWYSIIISATYLTSDTTAKYNDMEVIPNSIHTKWEEDDENLNLGSFNINILGGSCGTIVAEFKDYPIDVTSPLMYEIRNSNNDIVKAGKIEGELSAGTTNEIMFSPDEGEHYQILIFQTAGSNESAEFEFEACGSDRVGHDKDKVEIETGKPVEGVTEQLEDEERKKTESSSGAQGDKRQEDDKTYKQEAEKSENRDAGKDESQPLELSEEHADDQGKDSEEHPGDIKDENDGNEN